MRISNPQRVRRLIIEIFPFVLTSSSLRYIVRNRRTKFRLPQIFQGYENPQRISTDRRARSAIGSPTQMICTIIWRALDSGGACSRLLRPWPETGIPGAEAFLQILV